MDNKVDSLLSKAQELLDQKKFEEALKAFNKALKLDPTNADAWIGKGQAHRNMEEYAEALSCYDRAIELNPDDPYHYLDQADALQCLGNYDAAIRSIDRVLQLEPNLVWAWIEKGKSLTKLEKYEEALQSFDSAVKSDPENEWGWIHKAEVITALGKHEEALPLYDKAIKIAPKDNWGRLGKAETLIELKRHNDALSIYNEAIEVNPNDMFAWRFKAKLQAMLKQNDEALNSYKRAIEIDPANGNSWFLRGRFLSSLGKYSDALIDFKRAQQEYLLKKDQPGEKMARSWVLDLEKTIKEIEQQKEPSLEVKLLREIRKYFQKDPKEDPLKRIKEREEKFKRYFDKPRTIDEKSMFFTVLRRWNSFTPKIPNTEAGKDGGGYFLVWKNKGIVIDPGFDFMNNFDAAGYSLSDIDAVVLTHAHTDHTADLESLLCLKHEYAKQVSDSKKLDLFMNLGSTHKFIGWISRLGIVGNVTTLNAGASLHPEDYDFEIKAIQANHSEVIGDDRCIGLIFRLMEGNKICLDLGLTSDTGWSRTIQKQYKGCRLLCLHLGSIGNNEFDESLPLKGKKRLYPEHLGLIGTISMLTTIKPDLGIISEFGEELGDDRCFIAQTLDCAIDDQKRCLTGDIGLKVCLPDLSIYCDICGKYCDIQQIHESVRRKQGNAIHHCSSHQPQDIIDWMDRTVPRTIPERNE